MGKRANRPVERSHMFLSPFIVMLFFLSSMLVMLNTSLVVTAADPISVLVLKDEDGGDGTHVDIHSVLTGAGFNVDFGPEYWEWEGDNPSPWDYHVVILPDGVEWGNDMPFTGQNVLLQFIANGGGFIGTEWMSYDYSDGDGEFFNLGSIILSDYEDEAGGDDTLTVVVEHPITENVPASFYIDDYYYGINTVTSGTVLITGKNTGDALVVKDYGNGRVVYFSVGGNYDGNPFLDVPELAQLLIDSTTWAASAPPPKPGIGNVLLLSDEGTEGDMFSVLVNAGINVDFGPVYWAWDGTNPSPNDYDVVILPDGVEYGNDMEEDGQDALLDFVEGGGGFIAIEWFSYDYDDGYFDDLGPLVLSDSDGDWGDDSDTYYVEVEDHPITANVPDEFDLDDHTYSELPANPGTTVLITGDNCGDALIIDEYGDGRVVNFAMGGNYDEYHPFLDSEHFAQLLIDSVLWAGNIPVISELPDVRWTYLHGNTYQIFENGEWVSNPFPNLHDFFKVGGEVPIIQPMKSTKIFVRVGPDGTAYFKNNPDYKSGTIEMYFRGLYDDGTLRYEYFNITVLPAPERRTDPDEGPSVLEEILAPENIFNTTTCCIMPIVVCIVLGLLFFIYYVGRQRLKRAKLRHEFELEFEEDEEDEGLPKKPEGPEKET